MQPSVVHIILGTLSQPVLGVVFTTFFDTTSHCSLGQVWQFSPWSSHLVSFTVLHSGTSSLTFGVEISYRIVDSIMGGYNQNCRVSKSYSVSWYLMPTTPISSRVRLDQYNFGMDLCNKEHFIVATRLSIIEKGTVQGIHQLGNQRYSWRQM